MKAKIGITLDEDLLKRLDALADRRGVNRSQVIERACWLQSLQDEMSDALRESRRLSDDLRGKGVEAVAAAGEVEKSPSQRKYRKADQELMERFPQEWERAHGDEGGK